MSLELSGTTGVKGVAGSVSAPSIVGDDTNTGISFPSADTIKFSTGGVERMVINNSGVSGTGIVSTGGKVLQMVGNRYSTALTGTSSSFFDTGLTQTITLLGTNSKVVAWFHQPYDTARNDPIIGARFQASRTINGGSENTFEGQTENTGAYLGNNGAGNHVRFYGTFSMTLYDDLLGNQAAGTVLVYKMRARTENSSNSGDVRLFRAGRHGFITVMEFAA